MSFVEHARKLEEKLETVPESLKGDKMVVSATDIACAIGVLLITGAFVAWMIVDMVRG